MIIKLGENFSITESDIQDSDSIMSDPDINKRFSKFAQELKVLAPKANDFLYFSSIMLHAAEASVINEDGTIKKDASGNPIKCTWNKTGGTWRWECTDSSIKPYKNNNGDIFPEEELLKAYKKWIGKPLCVDHKSSEVDAIRGVIVDAYYDHKHKRVIGLCALDKVNFPELARKVATGYATCVSMGTAVGRAICTDCATVARVESEFCDHMKRKNSYGEINVDLQPIELSIVVNGADPRAKIKQIIASANYLQQRINSEQNVIAKLANTNLDKEEVTRLQNEINELKSSLASFEKEFNEVSKEVNKEGDLNDAISMTGGTSNEPSDEMTVSNVSAPYGPSARYADGLLIDLRKMASVFESKLNNLQKTLNNIKEENMSDISKKGYFQGAGGVNEPTPGTAKYPKDPMNDKLKTQDKHMVGQMDTGPVDGMHPGVDSSPTSEMELKKKLLRAQQEERALRRAGFAQQAKEVMATISKEGYFQGGGDVNEPTPGKRKYNVDPGEGKARKEDKQLQGKKPFPEVGKEDGLYGDDLKVKEKLSRASFKAKFVKAANSDGSDNLGKSAWQIYLNDKLVLTASVDQLTNGKSNLLYSGVATKEFGTNLLTSVKKLGADGVARMYKLSQQVPAAPAPAAAPAAPAAPGMPEMPQDPMAGLDMDMQSPEGEDAEGSGTPEEKIEKALDEVQNAASDAKQELEALKEEASTEIMEQPQGNLEQVAPAPNAPVTTASMKRFRRELNGALRENISALLKELRAHEKELKTVKHIFANNKSLSKEDRVYVRSIAEEAILDAKHAVADSEVLKSSFIRYAHGTENLIKKAQAEGRSLPKVTKVPEGEHGSEWYKNKDLRFSHIQDNHSTPSPIDDATLDEEIDRIINEMRSNEDFDPDGGQLDQSYEDESTEGELNEDESTDMDDYEQDEDLDTHGYDLDGEGEEGEEDEEGEEGTHNIVDSLDADTMGANKGQVEIDGKKFEVDKELADNVKGGKMPKAAQLNLSDKNDRIRYRAKLAAEAMKFSDMLDEAHPQGGFTTKLDVKPSGDLAKVEDLEEVHSKVLDLAKAPPKVRKDAQEIHQLISEGKLNKDDLDLLVAQGVDPAAVKYYKEMFEGTDGGKEFASELTKEHVKAAAEQEAKVYRAKVKRAYDMAYDMASRGLISEANISNEVDRIMAWNDEAFESMKKVVAQHSVKNVKTASQVPQVGLVERQQESSGKSEDDLYSALSEAFTSVKYNRF